MNGITKTEVKRIWALIAADEALWVELLVLEPRLSRTLGTAKERICAAELLSNFVQTLTQKGW